jgi:hypothetical protein
MGTANQDRVPHGPMWSTTAHTTQRGLELAAQAELLRGILKSPYK